LGQGQSPRDNGQCDRRAISVVFYSGWVGITIPKTECIGVFDGRLRSIRVDELWFSVGIKAPTGIFVAHRTSRTNDSGLSDDIVLEIRVATAGVIAFEIPIDDAERRRGRKLQFAFTRIPDFFRTRGGAAIPIHLITVITLLTTGLHSVATEGINDWVGTYGDNGFFLTRWTASIRGNDIVVITALAGVDDVVRTSPFNAGPHASTLTSISKLDTAIRSATVVAFCVTVITGFSPCNLPVSALRDTPIARRRTRPAVIDFTQGRTAIVVG
jgi:hypothetical protein